MFKQLCAGLILLTLITDLCFSQEDSDYAEIKKCVELKNKGEYKKAYKCLKKHKRNIYAIYHSAVICKQLNQTKNFLKLSEKLISKEFVSAKSYSFYCRLFTNDSDNYIKNINKGLKLYPNDINLLTEKSNYFIKTNKYNKLIPLLELMLKKKNYKDKKLYLSMGTAYQNINKLDSALISYKKSLDLDSTQSNVYYNIATIYYNKAATILDSANNIYDQKIYKKELEKANKKIKESLPYFLKAQKYKPKDIYILKALKSIYFRLKMKEDAERIKNKINELEKNK